MKLNRTVRKGVLVLLALFVFATMAFAGGQQEAAEEAGGEKEVKEISILTWNLPHYEDAINGWIEEFEAEHPNVKVKWIDKKGSEWATYFQTQIQSGNVPDLFDVQGALWYQYADMGVTMNLSPYFEEEPEMKERFNQDILEASSNYKGDYYMLPFYMPSTVLFYNKVMFEDAGLPGPPETFDELAEYSRKLADGEKSGFITLNFDWLYWPLFRTNGVKILNDAGTKAAFNTPAAVETLETLTALTEEGAIPNVAWTGRWKEPNGTFGAGNAGMLNAHTTALNAFRSAGEWVNEDTVGVAPFPGHWAVPNYHSLGISANSEHPDLAWEFAKLITNTKWAENICWTLGTLSGNEKADNNVLNDPTFAEENPILAETFKVELSNTGNLTGMTGSPKDAKIKEAVYKQIERALFGEVSAAEALEKAEADVNDILAD